MNTTTINNIVITLLAKETNYISGLTSLEELQQGIQDAYAVLASVSASDSVSTPSCRRLNGVKSLRDVYELVRGLAVKYSVSL